MNEIREVHYVESDSRSNTLIVVFFVVCIAALIGIVAVAWHPWAPTAPSTTIIRDQAPPVVTPPTTTIVTPPAPESRTDIHIDASKGSTEAGGSTKGDDQGSDERSDNADGATGDTGTTGTAGDPRPDSAR
ncbi:MAG: hypothetical protein JST30_08005 [Armatimonadetes bacterium]|nr:hypothetical protein [Armatimonadota bacterium]